MAEYPIDFQLVENSNDLALDGLGLYTSKSEAEYIQQKIFIKLRTFAGEYFLDNSLGIPFFDDVLIKSPNLSTIEAHFKAAISSVAGVEKILSFSLAVADNSRQLSVVFSVQLTNGTVIEGTL